MGQVVGRCAREAGRIVPCDGFDRAPEHRDVAHAAYVDDADAWEPGRERVAQFECTRGAGTDANHATAATHDDAPEHDATATDHDATDHDATDDPATDHDDDISGRGRRRLLTGALAGEECRCRFA